MNNSVKMLSPFVLYCQKVIPLAFDESMSYYECLCALYSYLKDTVVPAVNNNADALKEVQEKMIELKEYVDTYFDNLDIQTEINNKLDQMADDGELASVIAQYLNAQVCFAFPTVADMVDSELFADGSFAETMGFNSVGDNGGARYKIRGILNTDVIDNMTIFAITHDPTLVAELVVQDYVTPEMIGSNSDGVTDDSAYILKAFEIAKDNSISLILNKEYYISNDITLDGEGGTVNIEEKNGYLKVDGSILVYDITKSDLSFILNGGGSGNISDYSITFEKIIECNLNLNSDSVNQTAYYMHDYTGSTSRNTVILKGSDNLRTLYHGSQSPEIGGMFFGTYLDIEDRNPTNGIKFERCHDISILHIENLFEDQGYTKNSVEFINCGSIHCGTMALGGLCKNLLYLEGSSISIQEGLFVNENKVTDPALVTAIYCKNDCSLNIFTLRNVCCLYAIDGSQMTYGKKLHVDKVILEGSADVTPKGIYLQGYVDQGNYLLAYNDLNIIDTGITFSSDYGSIAARGYKKDGIVYVNGYVLMTTQCPANTPLFTINSSDKCMARDRVDFVASRQGTTYFMHFSSGSNGPLSDAAIPASQYQPFAFNFSYPAKHYEGM